MRNIKAGDLAMIVKPKPCCGYSKDIGTVFEVKKHYGNFGRCGQCGVLADPSETTQIGFKVAVHTSRVIKIDPPALQDETESEKELVA